MFYKAIIFTFLFFPTLAFATSLPIKNMLVHRVSQTSLSTPSDLITSLWNENQTDLSSGISITDLQKMEPVAQSIDLSNSFNMRVTDSFVVSKVEKWRQRFEVERSFWPILNYQQVEESYAQIQINSKKASLYYQRQDSVVDLAELQSQFSWGSILTDALEVSLSIGAQSFADVIGTEFVNHVYDLPQYYPIKTSYYLPYQEGFYGIERYRNR